MRTLFILSLCLVLAFHSGEAAVTCNTVVGDLYPCLSYVMQGGKAPTAECCNGVKALNRQAQSSADRQSVCRCIKNAIGGASYSSSNLNNAQSLPAKCGVNLPFRFIPSTNCNSLH